MVNLCLKYDSKEDWSYNLTKDKLEEHAKDWYKYNELLKKECPKYKIKYYDTSKDRLETLNNIVKDIKNLI